jgi:PBP1b-binding outer membrane lipoprotein LpoB
VIESVPSDGIPRIAPVVQWCDRISGQDGEDTGMTGRRGRALAGAALTGVLLLSGCSAAESGSSTSGARAADAAAPAAAPPKAAGTAGAGAGQEKTTGSAAPGTDAAAGRAIAYTGRMTVESADPAAIAARARQLAVAAGGFVGGESESGGGTGSYRAELVLRVPSAGYERMLDQLAALGTVLSRTSQADDLTQQVVDVESRVKTQQASVDRVRALLADAKSLADVVSLESELTRREADLESLRRQQQELSAQTSLSTITVDLQRTAAAPAPKAAPRGFWASIGHGFAGGWHVLLTLLRALAIGFAVLAPFLVVLLPGAWLTRRWLRRRQGRPRTAPVPVPGWQAPGWQAPGPHPGVPAQAQAQEPVSAPAPTPQRPTAEG